MQQQGQIGGKFEGRPAVVQRDFSLVTLKTEKGRMVIPREGMRPGELPAFLAGSGPTPNRKSTWLNSQYRNRHTN